MKVRRFIVAIAAVSAATIAAIAPSAQAATRHAAGSAKEYFLIVVSNNNESVVAHGVFVGGGKDVEANNSDVLHLGGGTLRITHPASASHFKDKVNPKTCFATITVTGRYTIGHGTGKYKGVTGHGAYQVNEQAILARTKGGACNENAAPKIQAGSIKASGPAAFK